jgi:hypothetical protein
MALAWGAEGHQTIGAIADRLIAGTDAQKQVRKILGSDLRSVSVWADCARGVTFAGGVFTYAPTIKSQACVPFETSSGKAEMVAFVKRNWNNCRPAAGDEVCHKQYHYTDVAIERAAYARNETGTSDHHVVGALDASIAVLQGKPSPAPFNIASKKEALRLLAHYVGDVHQPLHVAAVYLDPRGRIVDPDSGVFDPKTKTFGGNDLIDAGHPLHTEWDAIPATLTADQLGVSGVPEARKIPQAPGPVSSWPAEWASDTLQSGKIAFKGLAFSPEDAAHHWPTTVPATYRATRESAQRTQLIKAGAHLAQVLEAIWP